MQTFQNDTMDKAQGDRLIAGVDEAGRGPLAGAVFAAAVILHHPIEGLDDSKKLSEDKRCQLASQIKKQALSWAIGQAEVNEIEEINILQASLLAMKRALDGLRPQPTQALVDGNRTPQLDYPAKAIIKGDAKVAVISAASILAKVTRDEYMRNQDKQYPGYGFARHKGYPTVAHRQALARLGISPIHRRTFSSVKEVLNRL